MNDTGVDPIRGRLLALLGARRAERHAEIERLLSKGGAAGTEAPGAGAAVLEASLVRRRSELETGRRRLEELRALVLGREPSPASDRRAEAAAASFALPAVRLDIDVLRSRKEERRRDAEEERLRLEEVRRAELERSIAEPLLPVPEPAIAEAQALVLPAPEASVSEPASAAQAAPEPVLVEPVSAAPVETPLPAAVSSTFSMRSIYKSRTPAPASEPEAAGKTDAPPPELPTVDAGPAAELDLQTAELERALARLREIQGKLGRPQL